MTSPQFGPATMDCYLGNFHKWMHTPKTCAFAAFGPRFDGVFRSPAERGDPHDLARTDFVTFGVYDESTRGASAMLCLPAAINFHEKVLGAEQAHRNCQRAARA